MPLSQETYNQAFGNTAWQAPAVGGMSFLKAMQDAERMNLEKQKLAQQEKMGSMYSLGTLLGLPPTDPRASIPVSGKAAPSIVAQGVTASKPSTEEQQNVSNAQQMSELGGTLGKQWSDFGFSKATPEQATKGVLTGVLPGVLSQRVVGPEYKQFQDTKSLLSEIALRQATGAAAPPAEKKEYMGYLPEPGDNPAVAKNKITNFFQRVSAKAEQTAQRLEAQGLAAQASYYRTNVLRQLADQKAKMEQMFGAVPEAGGSDEIDLGGGMKARRKAK